MDIKMLKLLNQLMREIGFIKNIKISVRGLNGEEIEISIDNRDVLRIIDMEIQTTWSNTKLTRELIKVINIVDKEIDKINKKEGK